jgi:chitodextrinase
MPRERARSVSTRRLVRRWTAFWVLAVLAALAGYVGLSAVASRAAQSAAGASAEALLAAATAESAAGDPVIAAAGDIACDPSNSNFNGGNGVSNSCRQKAVSDLVFGKGYDAVLLLGDNQYYCGGYTAHVQSYDLSWGRFKSITKPSPGNHEYLTSGGTDCNSANAGADGYYRYFGALAGEKGKGYYSFDIGTWHIIALNSHCSGAGGCSSSTQQGQWLRNDLAAHKNVCTLAYWHVPLYSSGGRDDPTYKTFWDALYQYDADVVLSGHDHTYERFAPQNPNHGVDNARGIRQFVVGTGGANHTSFVTTMANSEVRNDNTFGVLKLTLHPTSYDWEFIPEAGKTFRDSGTTNCHGNTSDTIAPSTPTGLTASASPTKVDLSWNASTDNVGVLGYRVYRGGSLIATVTSGTSYSDTTVVPSTTYSYTVAAYDAGLNASPQSAPKSVTTPADTTAPTAPANLAAPNIGATAVMLTWTASTDDSGLAGYRIFRNNVEIGTSTTASYTDSTVQPQTTYSYFVRAYDLAANLSAPSNTINVLTPARPAVMTFTPAADTSIRADLPTTNFGNDGLIGIDSSPIEDLLLKFTVSGVAGRPIESAKLRLYCSDPGGSGGVFKRVANTSWSETSVNWGNAPVADASTIATLGPTTAGTWYEVDVKSVVTGDGTISFRVSGTSPNGTDYVSKEGTAGFAPQLVVTARNTAGDTQPPTAPTNLSATAPSPLRVDLTWTASTDNVGVTRYRVYRNGTQIATPTTASYSDTTVQPTTAYAYHVIAEDAAANSSSASNTANITTPADTSPPTSPTGLVATAADPNRVDLTWNGSSDDIGVDRYRIHRNGTQIATSIMPSYSDTTAQPNTSYSYSVDAVDAAGNISAPSNTANVTTPGVPPPAQTQTFTPVADTTLRADLPSNNFGSQTVVGIDSSPVTDLLLKFNVTGLAGRSVQSAKLRLYCFDPGGAGGAFKRVANSSWSESTVNWSNAPAADAATLGSIGATVAGTWYEVDVTSAVTGDGLVSLRASGSSPNGTDYHSKEGPAGLAPQLVVTAASSADTEPPTQPMNLLATAPSPVRVDLVWNESTDNVGVTGYRVYRDGAQIGTSTTTGYSDLTAQPNTAYSYHVVAYDAANNSSIPSTTANITTPADTIAPTAPTSLAASVISSSRVDLTWTASTDNIGVTGYRLLRNGTQIASPSGTSYSDTGLQAGTTYNYEVAAVDAAMNQSPLSNTATATTPSSARLTFAPAADATLRSGNPTGNAGSATLLEIDNSPVDHALLKFVVSGVGGRTVSSAKLRLNCTNASNVGGIFARVDNSSWSESTVNWNNAPAAGATLATLGAVTIGNWYEVDLTSLITGDGTYSIRVSTTSTDGVDYSSKEGANPPQLVLDVS